MTREIFDFGIIKHSNDNIISVIINSGVKVDKAVAQNVLSIIKSKLNQSSVLIIDRLNDYSYTAEGMMCLKDSNLSNIMATGIITYSKASAMIAAEQAKCMKEFGRTKLNLFHSPELAISWAHEILQNSLHNTKRLS